MFKIIQTRQDKTRQDKTRQDKTRQDKTRQDKTRQDKTRQDKTRQDNNLLACFLNNSVTMRVRARTIKNSLQRVSLWVIVMR